ncbi:MAG: hypothetical protein IT292_06145 [Deltaproteobacteria bacterium]|nr:hypothetical protein [Deltaproteobacteria bacterium]
MNPKNNSGKIKRVFLYDKSMDGRQESQRGGFCEAKSWGQKLSLHIFSRFRLGNVHNNTDPHIFKISIRLKLLPCEGLLKPFLVIFFLLSFVNYAVAQDDKESLDTKFISELLGNPSKVTGENTEFETWYYGESKVFIKKGKVIAWTDNGELKKLADLPKQRKVADKNKTEIYWPNPWTAPTIDQREGVIDEVLPQ